MQGILKAISKSISLALVITLIFSPATTSFAGQSTQGSSYATDHSGGDKWIPWVQAGGKLGDERAIGATEALVPLYQANDGMWFADVHFKDIDGSAWEGNVGGGYRQLFRDAAMPYILGINGFWDHANSNRGNAFNQGGVGVEFLAVDWDLRANGYFPESKTYLIEETYSDVTGFIINGNTIGTSSNRNQLLEDALPGFDVEAGVKIPGLPAPHELRVYGGYYYFDEDDAPTIDGPRVRAEWRIADVFNIPGSRITIEGSWQDDDVRQDEWFGGIAIRIPLDFFGRKYNKNQSPIEKRMMEGIVRDLDIVIADSTTVEQLTGPAINPFTGRPYSGIYFAEEGGAGAGVETDPTDLNGAASSVGVDGVIAALDTNGTINENLSLQTGQVLIGGGGQLPIQTPEGANGFLAIPGGGPATIDGGGSDVITLGDENIISDVTLVGGSDGIDGDTILSPWIRNVTADGNGDEGLELDDLTGDLLIENSSFDNNGDDGINIETVTGNVTILNTTADGNSSTGLSISGVTGDIFVDPSSFSNNGTRGVDIEGITGNITLLDVTADGNQFTNIDIDSVTGNILLSNVSGQNSNSGRGLVINDVFGDITVDNSNFDGNAFINVAIANNSGVTGDVTISNTTASDSVNSRGIDIGDNTIDGNVTLKNVTADDNNGTNLEISNVTGDVFVDPSSFSGSVNDRGIDIVNVDGSVTLKDVEANDNNNRNINIEDVEGDVLLDNVSGDDSVNARGVAVNDVSGDVTIKNSNFDGNQGTNINIGNDSTISGNVTIENTTANDSQNFRGIDINDVDGDVTLKDVTADDNDETNLEITDIGGDVFIDPSSFSGSINDRGIDINGVDGSVTLKDVTANDNNNRNINIENVGVDVLLDNVSGDDSNNARGVAINGVSGDVTIDNSNFNGNQGTNISIGNDNTINGNVLIRNTEASDSQNFRGIDINDIDGNVTLQNVTANDNDETNLEITNVGGDVFIDPSFFSGSNNGHGMDIESIGGTVTLEDVTASNNGLRGLSLDSTDDVTIRNSTFSGNQFTNADMESVGDVVIDGSNFTDSNSGRGLDIDSAGDVTFADSTFSNNAFRGLAINDVNDILGSDSSALNNGSTDITLSNYNSYDLDNVNYGSLSD